MKDFCKLFHHPEYGQVLVLLTTSDDDATPEVRVLAQPPGLGVCHVGLGFPNDDEEEAWAKAEQAFEQLNADAAFEAAGVLFGGPAAALRGERS